MQFELPSIPGYRVTGKLGQGAFGVVLSAESEVDPSSRVAIKVMKPGVHVRAKDVLRFRREGRVARELRHDNILPILDLGRSGEQEYIVMERVDGETLQQRLARRFSGQAATDFGSRGGLVEDLRVLAQVCRAVGYAHDHGVIHRDIKPGNVLVRSDGHPFLIDFGLARHLEGDSTLTSSDVIVGTFFYMSPEQLNGDTKRIGPASDVYSLGATLHAICTGRVPFTAQEFGELRRLVNEHEVPPAPAGIPKGLESIWLRALEKQPQHRYGSAAAMAEDLERALAGLLPFRFGTPLIALRGIRSLRRKQMLLASVAIVVLSFVAAAFWRHAHSTSNIHTRSLLAEGNGKLMLGDIESARTAFRRLKALRPDDAEPELHLAGVEFLLGRKSEARAHVEQARTLGFRPISSPSDNNIETYCTGLYWLANGDEATAITFLRKSVEGDDAAEHARLKLATLLWMHGAREEARLQLDTYIDRVAPRSPTSLNARILRHELNDDPRGAIVELDEGLQRYGPRHVENAEGTRGRLLLRLHCTEAATQELLIATRGVPDEPSNWLCLALCYLETGDWDAAARAATTGASLAPDSMLAHGILARIAVDREDFEEAGHRLRAAGTGLTDDAIEALVATERDFNEASRLLERGEQGDAVALLEECVGRTPDHLGALIELSQDHLLEGRHDRALHYAQRARDVTSRIKVPVRLGRDILQLPFMSEDNQLLLFQTLFASAVLVGDSAAAHEGRERVEALLAPRSQLSAAQAFNFAEALWNSRLPGFRDPERAASLLDSPIVDWSIPLSKRSIEVVEQIRSAAGH